MASWGYHSRSSATSFRDVADMVGSSPSNSFVKVPSEAPRDDRNPVTAKLVDPGDAADSFYGPHAAYHACFGTHKTASSNSYQQSLMDSTVHENKAGGNEHGWYSVHDTAPHSINMDTPRRLHMSLPSTAPSHYEHCQIVTPEEYYGLRHSDSYGRIAHVKGSASVHYYGPNHDDEVPVAMSPQARQVYLDEVAMPWPNIPNFDYYAPPRYSGYRHPYVEDGSHWNEDIDIHGGVQDLGWRKMRLASSKSYNGSNHNNGGWGHSAPSPIVHPTDRWGPQDCTSHAEPAASQYSGLQRSPPCEDREPPSWPARSPPPPPRLSPPPAARVLDRPAPVREREPSESCNWASHREVKSPSVWSHNDMESHLITEILKKTIKTHEILKYQHTQQLSDRIARIEAKLSVDGQPQGAIPNPSAVWGPDLGLAAPNMTAQAATGSTSHLADQLKALEKKLNHHIWTRAVRLDELSSEVDDLKLNMIRKPMEQGNVRDDIHYRGGDPWGIPTNSTRRWSYAASPIVGARKVGISAEEDSYSGRGDGDAYPAVDSGLGGWGRSYDDDRWNPPALPYSKSTSRHGWGSRDLGSLAPDEDAINGRWASAAEELEAEVNTVDDPSSGNAHDSWSDITSDWHTKDAWFVYSCEHETWGKCCNCIEAERAILHKDTDRFSDRWVAHYSMGDRSWSPVASGSCATQTPSSWDSSVGWG